MKDQDTYMYSRYGTFSILVVALFSVVFTGWPAGQLWEELFKRRIKKKPRINTCFPF